MPRASLVGYPLVFNWFGDVNPNPLTPKPASQFLVSKQVLGNQDTQDALELLLDIAGRFCFVCFVNIFLVE